MQGVPSDTADIAVRVQVDDQGILRTNITCVHLSYELCAGGVSVLVLCIRPLKKGAIYILDTYKTKSQTLWHQFTRCAASATMYHVQCTMYNVQRTMYNVQCRMHNIIATTYTVHCTTYTVQCTLYIVHCTVYIVRYTVTMHGTVNAAVV